MIIILNIILWIWSHFPILCLSDDSNFSTLELNKIKIKDKHLRFSLLNVMLGDVIIYLLTYDFKLKKLKFFYCLRLSDLEGILFTDEEAASKCDNYVKHINSITSEDIIVEKEKLSYHIQNEEKRIDVSINKLNIYSTIILTVLPLIVAIVDFKKILLSSYFGFFSILLVAYSLLNICIYIFKAIKVSGINKSRFCDLRESLEKEKTITSQYYYDWQQLRYKAQLFVSFVYNLQEWVVFTLVLLFAVFVGTSYTNYESDFSVNDVSSYMVATVNIEEINVPYSDSSVAWHSLLLNIEKEQCKEIIFIISDEYNFTLLESLEKYDDLKIDIFIDNTLDDEQMKIIQE